MKKHKYPRNLQIDIEGIKTWDENPQRAKGDSLDFKSKKQFAMFFDFARENPVSTASMSNSLFGLSENSSVYPLEVCPVGSFGILWSCLVLQPTILRLRPIVSQHIWKPAQ